MRDLDWINRDNQSDGKPMLDTHPNQSTLGLSVRTGQDDISGQVVFMDYRKRGWCGVWYVTNNPSHPHAYCRRDLGHTGSHSAARYNAEENETLRDPFYPIGDRW